MKYKIIIFVICFLLVTLSFPLVKSLDSEAHTTPIISSYEINHAFICGFYTLFNSTDEFITIETINLCVLYKGPNVSGFSHYPKGALLLILKNTMHVIACRFFILGRVDLVV